MTINCENLKRRKNIYTNRIKDNQKTIKSSKKIVKINKRFLLQTKKQIKKNC